MSRSGPIVGQRVDRLIVDDPFEGAVVASLGTFSGPSEWSCTIEVGTQESRVVRSITSFIRELRHFYAKNAREYAVRIGHRVAVARSWNAGDERRARVWTRKVGAEWRGEDLVLHEEVGRAVFKSLQDAGALAARWHRMRAGEELEYLSIVDQELDAWEAVRLVLLVGAA